MTDESDLLRAIVAAQDDDTPRSIYADWLDDEGDGIRADFIRTQLRLANTPSYRPEYLALESHLNSLHRYDHLWKIPGLRARQEFHRGFVENVWIRRDRLLAESSRLRDHPLVRRLRISGSERAETRWDQLEWMSRIVELDLTNHLTLRYTLTTLLEQIELPRLRSLLLRNVRLWPDDLLALLSQPALRNLQSLDLSGNPLGDEGIEALDEFDVPKSLTSLILKSDGVEQGDTIREAGFQRLARAKYLPHLNRLDLHGHRPGDAGLDALLTNGQFDSLTWLRVSFRGDFSSTRSLEALARFHPPTLDGLSLSGQWPEHEPAWPILESWLSNSSHTILDLHDLKIDELSISALGRSRHFGRIRMPECDESKLQDLQT